MVSLSLVSGLSTSPDGFPQALPRVFSGSLPAPFGLHGELNSLLELLGLCCGESTSLLDFLDSLGILSLVLPLGGQGRGGRLGLGRFMASLVPGSWSLGTSSS